MESKAEQNQEVKKASMPDPSQAPRPRPSNTVLIKDFLSPLPQSDSEQLLNLSREMAQTFTQLSGGPDSTEQFIATPISESILRHVNDDADLGKYLAIDIGGTNLRVGFVEIFGMSPATLIPGMRRLLDQSWPIVEDLKKDPDRLFSWIGKKIAEVVGMGCREFKLSRDEVLHLGCSFSFPMIQGSLSQALITTLGKGFSMTGNMLLHELLVSGYARHQGTLPPIIVAAIANDSVATLVSFLHQFKPELHQKAAMGLICGTGANATVLMAPNMLHPERRPLKVDVIPGKAGKEDRIAVNTEWSINGTAGPLRRLGMVTRWDEELDRQNDVPGFQPLEYMTAGRYLGELGRIIFLDFLEDMYAHTNFHPKLQQKYGLDTAFLGQLDPDGPRTLLEQLVAEFPPCDENTYVGFNELTAEALYRISLAIQKRAAGITAAATIGLLRCAGELPDPPQSGQENLGLEQRPTEIVVGYTGGCITGFQNYLRDCQNILDTLMVMEYKKTKLRVLLTPCDDGGINGAGVLVPVSLRSQRMKLREPA